jgi:hypothetical protein
MHCHHRLAGQGLRWGPSKGTRAMLALSVPYSRVAQCILRTFRQYGADRELCNFDFHPHIIHIYTCSHHCIGVIAVGKCRNITASLLHVGHTTCNGRVASYGSNQKARSNKARSNKARSNKARLRLGWRRYRRPTDAREAPSSKQLGQRCRSLPTY